MKKTLLLLLGLNLTSPVFAEHKLCGYTDFFHLGRDTNPNIIIVSANNSVNIYLHIIGPRSFEILDGYDCQKGAAHVTFAYDLNHWCVLDIRDGPRMQHPTITESCYGMVYNGMSYDGFNSYSYTINLS